MTKFYKSVREWDGIPIVVRGVSGSKYGFRTVFERRGLFGWPSPRYYESRYELIRLANVPERIHHIILNKAIYSAQFIRNGLISSDQARCVLKKYVESYDLKSRKWL